MFQRYRKHAILLGEWHFHPECSRWPETDYLEDDFPYPEDFCLECVRIYSSRTSFPTPFPLYEGAAIHPQARDLILGPLATPETIANATGFLRRR